MSRPIRGWGGNFVFPIGLKNIYFPDLSSCVEFHSKGTEEKSKMSKSIRGWVPSCFSDRTEKHKLGRGR